MQYKVTVLKDNKKLVKTLEAENEKSLLDYLQKNGYLTLEVKPVKRRSFFFFDRVSFNDIVDLTRQLAIMLNAGLTLVDCLDILKKQIIKEPLLKLIEDIDKDIRAGISFSSALKKYPQYFPNLYVSLVKSGEASGKLSDILLRLADNLEREREFKGKLKGALIYPVIVIIAMVLVMFIMVTFVIPKLLTMFKDFNIDLPLTTKILIKISEFSTKYWPLAIVFTVIIFLLTRRYLKTKQGRVMKDSLLLKIPIINRVVKIGALVDSTRTLAVLTKSGVSILDSLEIVVDTTDNIIFKQAFKNIAKQVEKGTSLGIAMQNEEIFPPILVQMTIVGENTGHLDDTLMRISRYFEIESELAIKAMTTLIEPAIILFLGVGVGFLVFSVITPIYQLTSSFQ